MAESEVVSRPWVASFEWTVPASLPTVWCLTGDFSAMEKWAPSLVSRSTIVDGAPQQPGCVRSVEAPPGAIDSSSVHAEERLLEMNFQKFTYKYEIVKCTVPFMVGYVATFQLADAGGDSTKVLWSYEAAPITGYEEVGFQSLMQAVYEGCIADLKKALSID